MQYRRLGKSSLEISRIGFGCMSLKEQESVHILQRALDLGINYFDTADLYDKGANEILVGKAFKDKREEVIIATKVGNQLRSDGSGWDWNPRKGYILNAVEESLRRLDTDYIDLYQLHGGTINDPIGETIEAFELLVKQGKIRYYGISSIRPNVVREWVERSNMVSDMVQYSLLDRRPEESILPLLKEKNIGVLVRGSVAQGLLIDKPAKAYLNYNEEQVKQVTSAVQSIANDKRDPSQIAIQYVLSNPAVTSAIVGIRTMEQLEEAIKTLDVPALSTNEIHLLQQAVPLNFYTEHR
jgi:aryl-alcohol dehydrogenase-like predicted oxidoreductase